MMSYHILIQDLQSTILDLTTLQVKLWNNPTSRIYCLWFLFTQVHELQTASTLATPINKSCASSTLPYFQVSYGPKLNNKNSTKLNNINNNNKKKEKSFKIFKRFLRKLSKKVQFSHE